MKSARVPITFEIFARHVQDSLRGTFRGPGLYSPHVMLDLMTVGSYKGDSEFFNLKLDEVSAPLAAQPHLNLHIIGSIVEWRKSVELPLANPGSAVERNLEALRLRFLPPAPLEYSRPAGFPDVFLPAGEAGGGAWENAG